MQPTTQTFQFDKDIGLTAKDIVSMLTPDTIANILTLQCTEGKACEKDHLYLKVSYQIRVQSPRKRYSRKQK